MAFRAQREDEPRPDEGLESLSKLHANGQSEEILARKRRRQTSLRHPTKDSSHPSRPSPYLNGVRSQLLPTSAIAVVSSSIVIPKSSSPSSEALMSDITALWRWKVTVRRL